MWIKNIIITGCVLWAGYSIYDWATAKHDDKQDNVPQQTHEYVERKPVDKTTMPNKDKNQEDKDKTEGIKRTRPYEIGKDLGNDISDFFEGMGSSIADKVKQGSKQYVEPWTQLGREAKPYVHDLRDNLTGLKTDYLDNLVK